MDACWIFLPAFAAAPIRRKRDTVVAREDSLDVKKQVDVVFSIANSLRGTYQSDKYKDVIIPMTIIRRIECALSPTRDAVAEAYERNHQIPGEVLRGIAGFSFYNTSRWTLAKLLAEPQSLPRNFKSYLDSFSPNIKRIVADLDFKKQIDRMAKGSKLTGVVRKFADLNLDPDRVGNIAMGYMFEEIIRRFSENADAGDHYTPREVVRLMVSLALAEGCEDLSEPGKNINVGDFACGTGGMLSCAQERLAEMCPEATVYLYGQEVNPESHAICLADMLIKGQREDRIKLADTMKEDCFPGEYMRLCLINPPFGQPWGGKDAAEGVEKAVNAEHLKAHGRFSAGLPAKGDMQLLFMQHVVRKLDPERGRACVISNGSPLFSGGTSSGESQIRRWLLENDLVEAIIGMPTDLFYNTGIGIYIWVISRNKRPERRGKVQLINATDIWEPMRRSLGKKRKYVSEEQADEIARIYRDFSETDRSRILPNEEFLYKEYAVYQPMQRSYRICGERIDAMCEGRFAQNMHDPAKMEELQLIDEADRTKEEAKRLADLEAAEPVFQQIVEVLRNNEDDEDWYDWKAFEKHLKQLFADVPDYRENETAAQRKAVIEKVMLALSVIDKKAPLRHKRDGSIEYDPATKDTEIVKMSENVDEHFAREVTPYVPDAAWFDEETPKAVKTGAEFPFTRYFYRYEPPRPSEELLGEFLAEEDELEQLIEGLR